MNIFPFKVLIVFFVFVNQSSFAQDSPKSISYFNPQWSPDGKSIAFESNQDGKSAIYTVSPLGTNLLKITDTSSAYGQPAWSPDGKQLVYYGSRRPMQLYVNSNKGGEQKQLPTPGLDAYQPSWSAQGQIAFDTRPVGQTPNDISVMNADGSGYRQLTVDSNYDCTSPLWSSDGKTIYFQRSLAIRKPWNEITKEERQRKNASMQLMKMNADGSEIKTVITGLEGETAFTLSADGKFIYYLSKQDTMPVVYRRKPGANLSDPVITLFGTIYSLGISPDGKQLVYAAERLKKHGIYMVKLEDKEVMRIVGE